MASFVVDSKTLWVRPPQEARLFHQDDGFRLVGSHLRHPRTQFSQGIKGKGIPGHPPPKKKSKGLLVSHLQAQGEAEELDLGPERQ